MAHHWHAPLDPACPDVESYLRVLYDDPMTAHSRCADEIVTDFERWHRRACPRCREYRAVNIGVREGGDQ